MKRVEHLLGGEKFESLTVDQMMESRVKFCHEHAAWKDLAHTMIDGGYGSIPVVDEDNSLVGIVAEQDLLRVLSEGKNVDEVCAGDIMSKAPVSVTEATTSKEIVKILEERHLIRVPVVREGKLVGIVARRDILLGFLNATLERPHWL